MTSPLAAIVHEGHGVAEPILQTFVAQLRSAGWRVCGLLQDSDVVMVDDPVSGSYCQRNMELVDVEGGERFVISQNLGKGSTACCLDAAGVAAASAVLRRALQEGPDLIVANRFGKLEAEGDGLLQEMAAIVAAGVPLVTAVEQRFLPQWQAFADEWGQTLPPSVDAAMQWWEALTRARQCTPAVKGRS
ncbi:hypothetical protein AAV94_09930 [Lampropedia cohaerens]|uniref:Molybdenum ABC transporter ATP-binding protein n=1 Tax=Lampropedia cohaerens TaxID=1610491 RepID=A0A0U1PY75_9BURK|nr:DUF2478 domain-containing protein [Lampropedia cohaerens]KKW67478.1 hypothetical protein AAV94_09930 [Lampropedia cohaerens]